MSWGTKYSVTYKTWFGDVALVSLMDAGKGTFDSGTESWVKFGNNTIENDAGALKITYVDNSAGAYDFFRAAGDLSTNLTIGKTYKVFVKAKVNAGSSVKLYICGPNFVFATVTETDFTWFSSVFIATGASNNYIQLNSMAAGEILWIDEWYIMDWTDTTEIYIKERDYTGAVTELTAGEEPLKLSLKGTEDDIFFPIKQTSAEIQVMATSDFQFIELFTSDSKKYQVQILKDGVSWWVGYLIADQYEEPYQQPSYTVTLYATDGLGWLQNMPYLDAEAQITGKKSLLSLCNGIFGEILETYLDIYEGVNIYEDNISSTSADSITDQIYYDSGGVYFTMPDITYYDVLCNYLRCYNAYLVQAGGAWHIIRVPENRASYTRRRFVWGSPNYAYSSNASFDPVVTTTSKSVLKSLLVRLWGNMLSIVPGWKRFTTNQDYGNKVQMAQGGDFPYEDFTYAGGLWTNANWVKSGTPVIYPILIGMTTPKITCARDNSITGSSTFRVPSNQLRTHLHRNSSASQVNTNPRRSIYVGEYDQIFSAQTGMNLSDVAAIGSADYVVNTIGTINVSATDKILFYLKYGIKDAPATYRIYVEVVLTGANTKYMDEDGVWQAVQAYAVDNQGLSDYNIVKEIQVISDVIPLTGTLEIRLYELVTATSPTEFIIHQCYCYYLLDGEHDIVSNKITDVVVNDNFSITPEVSDYIMGDGPATDNDALIYNNLLYYNDSGYIPTTAWTEGGVSDLLLNHTVTNISRQYSVPRQQITGKIISKLVGWNSVIKETNNDDRIFQIIEGCLYDKQGLIDVKMQQLIASTNLITGWTNAAAPPQWETFTKTGALITSAINSDAGALAYTNAVTYSSGDWFVLKWSADAVDVDGYFEIGGTAVFITTTIGSAIIHTINDTYQLAYFKMDSGNTGTFTNITFYLYKY
jgi:hypothetical protein